MYQVAFSLHLTTEQLLHYYRGRVQQVQVISDDGRSISFPLDRLRPFVTHTGVRGRFALQFDAQHKFVALQRLG